jgi:hypothetical protein
VVVAPVWVVRARHCREKGQTVPSILVIFWNLTTEPQKTHWVEVPEEKYTAQCSRFLSPGIHTKDNPQHTWIDRSLSIL